MTFSIFKNSFILITKQDTNKPRFIEFLIKTYTNSNMASVYYKKINIGVDRSPVHDAGYHRNVAPHRSSIQLAG